MNNKENFLSIFRSLLTAVGSYFIGKSFMGNEIDDNTMVGWIGVVVTVASTIWGIIDKTATLDRVQSAFRSSFTIIGELLVGAGYINNEVLNQTLMIGATAIPMLMSQTSKVQNRKVAKGETKIADLPGVDPQKIPIAPDTTPVKSK